MFVRIIAVRGLINSGWAYFIVTFFGVNCADY